MELNQYVDQWTVDFIIKLVSLEAIDAHWLSDNTRVGDL